MDVRTDYDDVEERGFGEEFESRAPAEPRSTPSSSGRHSVLERPLVQEASFRVSESGKIRFFVQPEVERPATLEDVLRFSFTLAPRNGGLVRRVSIGEKRLPDARAREQKWAWVDRVGTAAHVVSDLGPRRYVTKTRGVRHRAGLLEVASGTYAITVHRDHVHLMFELAGRDPENALLLEQLGVGPRGSYVAAVFNPQARWTVAKDKRRFVPLDPELLDHEGTELVLIGGDQAPWADFASAERPQ
jgi:hypothetical protein